MTNGMRPDSSLCEAVISAFCDCNMLDDALHVIREMERLGPRPTMRHMNIIASAAGRVKGVLEGESWVVGKFAAIGARLSPSAARAADCAHAVVALPPSPPLQITCLAARSSETLVAQRPG